jgi:hypothetical protein
MNIVKQIQELGLSDEEKMVLIEELTYYGMMGCHLPLALLLRIHYGNIERERLGSDFSLRDAAMIQSKVEEILKDTVASEYVVE